MFTRNIYKFALFTILSVSSHYANAAPISYEIGWTGSGSYAFENQNFVLSLTGDTSNVTNASTAIINEPLSANLTGPFGISVDNVNQFLGIQTASLTPSLVFGPGGGSYTDILDLDASSISNYDMRSSIATFNLDGGLLDNNYWQNITFTDASDFTFAAITQQDSSINYIITWTGSGSYAFDNQNFVLSLTGDTSNVTTSSNAIINEPLSANLTGPFGISVDSANQFLGIQTASSTPSLVFGPYSGGYPNILDLDASSILNYDMRSSVAQFNLGGGFLGNNYWQNITFTDTNNFTFAANTVSAVPEPPAILLLGIGFIVFIITRKES